jgi:hypothetical protein
MKKLTLTVILIMGLAAAAAAENLTLSLFQTSTDNLFQTSFPEKDQVSSLSFSFDKSFAPFSFFTEGGYSYLYQNSSVSYYAQDLGLDYLHAFSEKTAFYASAKVGGALYRSDYSDFNYLNFGVISAVKSYLTPASIMKLNATFNYRGYRYSVFDYYSWLVSFSLDKYFDTRTTLRAEVNWGYKYFVHPFAPEAAAMDGPVEYERGWRRGPGSGYMWSSDPVTTEAVGPGQGIQISSLSGLIAQGLADRVGLRLSGVRQWTLSGENPFSTVAEFYMVENPTYDVFSWNGYALSGQLTVEAPWNTQVKMGYTRSVKEFPGIEAMDVEGASLGMLRQDTRNQLDARLEKNFPAFSVFLSYSYVNNGSNDPLFNWKGHFLGVGFEWSINWEGTK